MRFTSVLTGLLLIALAGCASFPRGAGLRSEVLGTAATPGAAEITPEEAGFAIEPVTRDRLAAYGSWPATGETALPWINRVDQPDTRIIAPGDTVTITIWTTEDNGLLTAPGQRSVNLPEMQVDSAGDIFLPYLGEVRISGMAPETARARIEERYIEVMPSAQVQLGLQEGRQNTVALVGGAAAPGSYPLPDRDYTVLELIADSGGARAGLVNPQLRLHRAGRVYGTSLARLSADPGLDTTLVGGDRLFIEPDSRSFLSLGAAGTQAQHPFPQDEISALDALAIIGGVAETRANAQGILILRTYPDNTVRSDGSGPRHVRTIFTIDLTTADGLFSAGRFRIRPDDLVYVTESPLIGTRNLFGLIGSAFGLANQIGN